MVLLKQVYKDYRRYRAAGNGPIETILILGFWATCAYRLSKSIVTNVRTRFLRRILLIPCVIINKFVEIITGIYIPTQCEIGDGLYMIHAGMIIFPSQGRLGRNCNVANGVTLGIAGRGEDRGAPILGDRVWVGPNAIVIGKISVGDDAFICAGAVVLRSVPPRAVVLGNPARVVSYEGSFDHIHYDGMETDPERIASLNCRTGAQADRSPAVPAAIDQSEVGV